jgi:hypothetical protein
MRHRNMLRATGVPGWARFGVSPGWAGRGGRGPGPCAQFLMTGQWPVPAANPMPETGGPAPGTENRVELIQAQAAMLQAQLDALQSQIEALTRNA